MEAIEYVALTVKRRFSDNQRLEDQQLGPLASDETDTLGRFRQLRAQLIDPTIAQFQGSIVGTAGDSLLVEFAYAMAAVECAVACQRGVGEP